MTALTDNGLNDRDDYLNTDNDSAQGTGNSDAAKFNTGEQEQFVNERMETEDDTAQNVNIEAVPAAENQQPLTTQGDISEIEENMGGTTNLTLDQLKQEGDPERMDGE